MSFYHSVKLVFLDFDGVLRRDTSPLYSLELDLVSNLETVILATPDTNNKSFGFGSITRSLREISRENKKARPIKPG